MNRQILQSMKIRETTMNREILKCVLMLAMFVAGSGGYVLSGKAVAPASGADGKAVGAPDEAAARRLMLKWIKDNNRDAEWKDINGGAPIAAEQILVKADPNLPHLWQVAVLFKKGGASASTSKGPPDGFCCRWTRAIPPHSPAPIPVLTVSGAASAKANS